MATTIVSVGNPDLNFVPGLGVTEHQMLSVSWTAEKAYQNVSISAPLVQADMVNPLYAYLTTTIGPGTTETNQIAASTVHFAPASNPTVQLFSGLSLNPGTYYLTLWSPTAGGGWEFSQSPTIVNDSGVTIGSSQFLILAFGSQGQYIPSLRPVNLYPGTDLVFDVTGEDLEVGTPTVAPEPSVLCLLALGLIGFGSAAMRMRTQTPAQI